MVGFVPHVFWRYFFIFLSGKKCAIVTTNSGDEDVDSLRYVCILTELSYTHQSTFSPEHVTPKKARTKEPSTSSKSIRSVFVYFLYWFYLGALNSFFFRSGKKCAVAITTLDNEDVFVPRYVLCIIFLCELCIDLDSVLSMWPPRKLAPRNPFPSP